MAAEPGGAGSPGGVPVLHAVAGAEEAESEDFVERARRLLEACGPAAAVHLRLPDDSGRRLFELAAELSEAAARGGGWCVVNGRPDVALAAGAQAVQVGSRAIPLEETLRLVAGRLAIGASVHAPEEAVEAARRGANYVLLGTIYATPSHPDRPGAGPALVRTTTAALGGAGLGGVPVVAIGGIDAERAAAVRAAGAHGVAARRAVWGGPDPAAAARELVARLGASC